VQSFIVNNMPEGTTKSGYSELQVLESAAGLYVGTTFTENGFTEPGSHTRA